MSNRDDIDKILADASGEERAELDELVHRLAQEVPYPTPGFRAKLRQTIAIKSKRRRRSAPLAPARLRLLIASYAGSGLVLLLVAAAGVAGAGPFAA